MEMMTSQAVRSEIRQHLNDLKSTLTDSRADSARVEILLLRSPYQALSYTEFDNDDSPYCKILKGKFDNR